MRSDFSFKNAKYPYYSYLYLVVLILYYCTTTSRQSYFILSIILCVLQCFRNGIWREYYLSTVSSLEIWRETRTTYVCRYCGVEPNWQYGALVIVSLQDCSPVEYFSNT